MKRSSAVFLGEFAYRVDPQGRVAIPPRFRDSFEGGLVLTPGYERCVAAFTPEGWEEFSRMIASMPITQTRSRRLRRMTFGGAFDLKLDRQGRVLLPPPLRRYASLQEEVVVVGMGDYLEIWDAELWTRERELIQESAWQLAESAEERPR